MIAVLHALFAAALVTSGADATPSIAIPELPAAPPLTASLDGAWSGAASVHLGYEATYHKPAAEDTLVRIGRFGDTLYVAFVATQHEPITATQVTDGTGVLNDDAVMVHIWPNGLHGFAYWFATNALGARDQYSSENSAYAPTWLAFGRHTADGYVAILKIPLRAMHVEKNAAWRIQFHRMVVASNSNYVWELAPEQASFIDARYAGNVVGLTSTKGSTLRPRVQLYGLGEVAPDSIGGSTSHVGADISVPITGTTSVFGTVHPDFSNVEIDQQSIAPTEFARRFSEVRPFFTQAASAFGKQTDFNAPMALLYTPAIPTFHDGFGIEGQQGALSFGAFDALGNHRSDSAVALFASDPNQELTLGFQRVGLNLNGATSGDFRDAVQEENVSLFNPHTHLTSFADMATESGTSVTSPGDAQYRSVGEDYQTSTATAGVAFQKMGPQFSPADGYSNQPPGASGIAGYTTYASKQINFSPTARILDVAFSANADRYHAPSGEVNQADFGDSLRVDFKNLVTLTAFQGIAALATGSQFLPYNSGGYMIQYAANTSHPSMLMFTSGAYYHGRLDAWTRTTALPLAKNATLSLEADDNVYESSLAGEPNTKQWLERASLNYQFNRALSVDFGARRILGTTQPFAFAPFGSSGAQFLDGTNISAAVHFFSGNNELYIVYGDPNELQTMPALFVKLIRYIGAGKGS